MSRIAAVTAMTGGGMGFEENAIGGVESQMIKGGADPGLP